MTNKFVLTYLVYLPVVTLLTLFVARSLFKNGRVFILDIFRGRTDIADSTNRLFEVGFYLINIGFALRIMEVDGYWSDNPFDTNQEVVETLAGKIGGFAIYLGIMLFLNLFLFMRGRNRSNLKRPAAPLGPITVGTFQ